jgi:hypothetical protein
MVNSAVTSGRSQVGGAAYLDEIGYAVSATSRTRTNGV